MMRHVKDIGIRVTALMLMPMLGLGYALADTPDSSEEYIRPAGMARILVMPFKNMSQIHGPDNTVRGPVTRKVFITRSVVQRAERTMDLSLRQLLSRNKSVSWKSPKTNDLLSLSNSLDGTALIKTLQQMARKNNSDGVLVGYLYAFREREGGAYGAEIPARVTFELALLKADNGAVIWQKRFSETQKALNENLLNFGKFIKRKGQWITARDMGREAIAEMLKTLPRQGP